MTRSVPALVGLLLIVATLGPTAVGQVAADDVTLTVTVSNQFGGTVDGASLTATWDGGSTAETTAANGQALLDVPEGADVTITVEHEQYVRNQPVTVENAQSRHVDIRVGERGAATVSVTGDGGPVSGASVRFLEGGQTAVSATTDADGVATLDPIEQGTYDVVVSKGGFYRERLTLGVGEGTERAVSLQRGTVQVTFNVTDDHFEEPRAIRNATIDVQPLGTSLVTLSDGQVTTNLPVNRDYDVTVSKDGYGTAERTLPVTQGDIEYDVSMRRTPSLEVAAANQRVVVGETTRVTVINEYDEPAEDVPLLVEDAEIVRTDADGEADVPIESAGTVTIRAVYQGIESSTTVEGVQADGTEPANGTATSTDGGIGPGFGVAGAVTALAALAMLVRLGRRD